MIELIAGDRSHPIIPTYRLGLLVVFAGVVALLAGAGPRLAGVAVLLLPQLHLLAQGGLGLHSTVKRKHQYELKKYILPRMFLILIKSPAC